MVRMLVAIFVLLANSANAIDIDSLLAKSVGGPEAVERLRTARTFRVTGEVNMGGMVGSYSVDIVAPDKMFLEMTFEIRGHGGGVFPPAQGYDGVIAWQRDMNDQITLVSGAEKEELLNDLHLSTFAYLFPERRTGEFSYLGEVNVGDEFCHKLAYKAENGEINWFYIERGSGHLIRVEHLMDNLMVSTVCRDYKLVSGVLYPAFSETTIESLDTYISLTTEKFEIDAEIDPHVFEMPALSNSDYRFPERVDRVAIPFTYERGHIRLPVTINGVKKVWMILDSGASSNIFNESSVAELNLVPVGSLPALGIGGSIDLALVLTDSVSVGDLTLRGQIAGCTRLPARLGKTENGVEFGGVLGYDFLSRFPTLIDYSNSSMTVFNPVEFDPPEGGTPVDFYLTKRVPTVEGTFVGIPGHFIVDLGNAMGLAVHSQFLQQHSIVDSLTNYKEGSGSMSGIGGEVKGNYAVASSFELGGLEFGPLTVVLPDSSAGLVGSEDIDGNIGNRVLENHRVLLDYGNRRLILYPGN